MFKTCCGDCGECWYVGNPRTCTCPDETTKRPWVGLTDEEQQQAYEQWQNEGWGVFYNAIEAKLKEKNNV